MDFVPYERPDGFVWQDEDAAFVQENRFFATEKLFQVSRIVEDDIRQFKLTVTYSWVSWNSPTDSRTLQKT